MDPPIPPNILETLEAAEADLRILKFKYKGLTVANAKRPAAVATADDKGGGIGTADKASTEEGGLSEEDVRVLLEQDVSDLTKS